MSATSEPDSLPDLVEYRGIPFARVKARKATECWHDRADIKPGDVSFAPLSNGLNRMQRLCLRCARKFEWKGNR